MALFVPDPDDFDVEEFIERLGFDLAERYRDAEDELIRQIAERAYRDLALQQMLPDTQVGGGLTAAQRREQNRILALLAGHRARAIRELQYLAAEIVAKLSPRDLAEMLVDLAAREGEAAAAAALGLAARIPTAAGVISSFAGPGAQAVGALVLSLQSRLEVLNERITRYPQDAYQQIVSLTAPNTLLGVTTSLRQQQDTVRRFLAEGIDAFVDRAGRTWKIGTYAEMAGRTAVHRAFNDVAIARMQQSGIRLGVIVGGFDACARCAPWIGKVLSLDGSGAGVRIMASATTGQPVPVTVHGSLSQARAAGWDHPNCRDRVVAYLAGTSVPQADFEYNEAAANERDRQRALERAIRAAKRDVALAADDVTRRRAERALAEAQEARRALTRRTGRGPRYYREQLHFTDGPRRPRR